MKPATARNGGKFAEILKLPATDIGAAERRALDAATTVRGPAARLRPWP